MMFNPLFIIQKDAFEDETPLLTQALDDRGVEWCYDAPESIVGGQPLFIRGTIGFHKDVVRGFDDYLNVVCPINLDYYTYSGYVRDIEQLMLNQRFLCMPWWQLKLRFDWYFTVFETDKLFIRPNSGEKLFTGTTFGRAYAAKELEIIENLPWSRVMDNDIIILAAAQEIINEYRLVMQGRKVLDFACYTSDKGNLKYVSDFWDILKGVEFPENFYTLDIAETPNGLKIVEVNALASSGWYDCDPGFIVDAILEECK